MPLLVMLVSQRASEPLRLRPNASRGLRLRWRFRFCVGFDFDCLFHFASSDFVNSFDSSFGLVSIDHPRDFRLGVVLSTDVVEDACETNDFFPPVAFVDCAFEGLGDLFHDDAPAVVVAGAFEQNDLERPCKEWVVSPLDLVVSNEERCCLFSFVEAPGCHDHCVPVLCRFFGFC